MESTIECGDLDVAQLWSNQPTPYLHCNKVVILVLEYFEKKIPQFPSSNNKKFTKINNAKRIKSVDKKRLFEKELF